MVHSAQAAQPMREHRQDMANAERSVYKDLDDVICSHLEREPWRHPIHVESLAQTAAKALGREQSHGDDKEWRLIDRRLQAMRKEGRIRHVREIGLKPGWEVQAERGG